MDESDLPKITDIIVLDLLVCKLRVTIDDRLGPDDEIIWYKYNCLLVYNSG